MRLRTTFRHLLLAASYGVVGIVVAGLTLFISHMRDRPDLQPWHLAALDGEFSAADSDRIRGLGDYLRLEDELFAELDAEVYSKLPENLSRINRFRRGSVVDPASFGQNWNRTFELPVERPRAGFLMLHGLSDSPYSWRALGQALHERGIWVVGLRLPGHGTAPVGLAEVDWQDFTAAVRLAARDMAAKLGAERPLYLAGYSNGAALAVQYSLAVLEGEDLPRPAGLLLISPAIAVSSTAALAEWSLRLARLPGLEKLAWLSILPEYDPFKYNSFAVNAGQQIYGLTSDIAARIDRLDPGTGIRDFPPILGFQSVVDSTIPPAALVQSLLARLAPNKHRLVLFDVNREADTAALFAADPRAAVEELLQHELPFELDLITNRDPQSLDLMAVHKAALEPGFSEQPLALAWPKEIYSLSHVALPFPADDPAYGASDAAAGRDVTLGSVELRGELAVLQVPLEQFMRLRYNPFFPYLRQAVLDRYASNPEAGQSVPTAKVRAP